MQKELSPISHKPFLASFLLLIVLTPLMVLGVLVQPAMAGDQTRAADRIVFLRDDALWTSDSMGRNQALVQAFDQLNSGVAVSPDGEWAAVSPGVDPETGLGQICLVSLTGKMQHRLMAEGVHSMYCPWFSPDGRSLLLIGAVNVGKDPQYDMVKADMSVLSVGLADGRVTTFLTQKDVILDTGYAFSNPAFSPDGQFIAVQTSGSDVSGGFFIIDRQGRNLFQYPDDEKPFWRPQFSADGRKILCYSLPVTQNGRSFIYLVDLTTRKKELVTEGANPTWVENGQAIVFERHVQEGDLMETSLWRLKLAPGEKSLRIVSGGSNPAAPAPR